MSDHQIKLSYNSAQRIVRADFEMILCLEDASAYKGIIEKAKTKLESEINQGNVDFYEFYGDRLAEVWSTIRARFQGKSPKKTLSIMLGQGARLINHIEVHPGDGDELIKISFNAPAVAIANWRIEWVYLNVQKALRELGISDRPNEPQILGAWLRACEGEVVKELPIAAAPKWEPNSAKPFKLIANRTRREIAIAIHDPKVFLDKEKLNAILKSAHEATGKMSLGSNEEYPLRKNELLAEIKNAMAGPECLGIGLPMLTLVALGRVLSEKTKHEVEEPSFQVPTAKQGNNSPELELKIPPKAHPSNVTVNERKAEKKKSKSKTATSDYPGKGILCVDVSDNNLEATIVGFDPLLYADSAFVPDSEWLSKELAGLSIVPEPQKLFSEVATALMQKKDINGMMVAAGTPGKAASKPYLHKSYMDISSRGANIREARSIVKPGDLVCEIKYKFKMIPGKDVYGNVIEPSDGETLDLEIGYGIEMRDEGRYYSTIEGMPVFEKNKIEVSEIFIHKGNINLKSGDIYFNGSAIIEGSIETGSTVMVRGDLEVKGSIEGAFVRSGGSITVRGGITTTDQGRVMARCDLTAEFIGNSNIACGGDLRVNKAILNSSVISGGAIELNRTDGTLAGGVISCRCDIITASLGFPKGDKTVINAGLDWRAELTLRIRRGRLAKLKVKNEIDRLAMRELIRKKDAQMTSKHREMVEALKTQLQRQRELMDLLEEKIRVAETMMNWDKDVCIHVYEGLSSNVEIQIGGNKVPVAMNVAGVTITAQKGKGIVPLQHSDAS